MHLAKIAKIAKVKGSLCALGGLCERNLENLAESAGIAEVRRSFRAADQARLTVWGSRAAGLQVH